VCGDGCDAFDACLDTSVVLDVSCNGATNLCEGSPETCRAADVCEAAMCVESAGVPTATPTGWLALLIGLGVVGAGAATLLRRS